VRASGVVEVPRLCPGRLASPQVSGSRSGRRASPSPARPVVEQPHVDLGAAQRAGRCHRSARRSTPARRRPGSARRPRAPGRVIGRPPRSRWREHVHQNPIAWTRLNASAATSSPYSTGSPTRRPWSNTRQVPGGKRQADQRHQQRADAAPPAPRASASRNLPEARVDPLAGRGSGAPVCRRRGAILSPTLHRYSQT